MWRLIIVSPKDTVLFRTVFQCGRLRTIMESNVSARIIVAESHNQSVFQYFAFVFDLFV